MSQSSRFRQLSIAFICCFTLISCTTGETPKDDDYINYIGFSADGQKLIFDRQHEADRYLINAYDLRTGELQAYQSPQNEKWTMAKYSDDGKYIVFSIIPKLDNRAQLSDMQLAIMKPDGTKIKIITRSFGPKIYPSFSHSGTNIIYTKAAVIRNEGHTPAADYDIYTTDIATGKETRLTFFDLFIATSPAFFPDDLTIIFSAYGTQTEYLKRSDDNITMIVNRDEKRNLWKIKRERLSSWTNIYIAQANNSTLPDPIIFDKTLSLNPLLSTNSEITNPIVSRDGEHILFTGTALRTSGRFTDGDQVFEYIRNGKHRRLTFLPFTRIYSTALSPDGRSLAVIFSRIRDRSSKRTIALCDIANGTYREIALPDHPSRIINAH